MYNIQQQQCNNSLVMSQRYICIAIFKKKINKDLEMMCSQSLLNND